jgi:hypothetical protein
MNDDLSFVVGKPYCIWYPETAKEDTYRKLYKIHPEMAPMIARACSVAGYINLLREMDFPPEIHCLKDASTDEVKQFMLRKKPVSLMDDNLRTIKQSRGVLMSLKEYTSLTYNIEYVTDSTISLDDVQYDPLSIDIIGASFVSCQRIIYKMNIIKSSIGE